MPILLLLVSALTGTALESGALIPSAAQDGCAPLSTDAIINVPLGVARITGATEPDLFLATDRFGLEKGMFLYRFERRGAQGEPVFSQYARVGHPFENAYPSRGVILQTGDGAVHAFWPRDGGILHCVLDVDAMRFEAQNTIAVNGLPRGFRDLGIVINTEGAATALFGVGDGTAYSSWTGSTRAPEYDPYDGRGIWRGGIPYAALWAAPLPGFDAISVDATVVSDRARDVSVGYNGFTALELGEGRWGILGGSHFGDFHYYANEPDGFAERKHVVDADGIALRHPSIHPIPVAYPNPGTGLSDFIAAGEGGVYWYRFTGNFTNQDKPIFEAPLPVLETNADLYAGSLPVTNVVDWDGDGDQDIVAGNSEGFILFFENWGNNDAPRFVPGTQIEAGGRPIHIQPGYRLDIQGPLEARWGYVCPTVVDWDQDGDLDIVLSDSTARHTYFENAGSATSPELEPGRFLYLDGLDLYGTWRVQPAAGLMDGRMAYIALDGDDEFHLYWQQDSRNVTEGFKLRLDTGEVIKANFLDAGGTGRLKLALGDWDQDGVKDIIVGTPRHGSVPDPENGLPQSLGLPGSSVLFLKNVGTESAPKYMRPELFAFQGKPIYLGQHACGPALADFGGVKGPDLIVGHESGRFFYFKRDDLSTMKAEDIGPEYRGRKD